MAARTSTNISFVRFYQGIQTGVVTPKRIEAGYSPSGSVRDDYVHETIDTEGLETMSDGKVLAQTLTQWLGEIQPQDGQRALVSDVGLTAVYLRIGYADEPDDVFWYARLKSGAVMPRAWHFDRGEFNRKAAYRIEFERASAFQRVSGQMITLARPGSPPPSEYGLGLDMTNSGAGCLSTLTTPSSNAGDTNGFAEFLFWNRTSGKSISRVFIGGQRSAAISPLVCSWGATSCPANGTITLIGSGSVDLSKFTTGDVRPILRTNAVGGVDPNTRWAASDMEFTLDDGATWAPFEYAHAIAHRGRIMRLPVPRIGTLPGVNPTISLRVRNLGTTARILAAGELYLFPCDVWTELHCATPAAYGQAVVAGGLRGDLSGITAGMVSGGGTLIANMDTSGNPTSVIPDSVNRVGKPIALLPGSTYTFAALVEMSDGTAPSTAAFRIKTFYVPRRRSI